MNDAIVRQGGDFGKSDQFGFVSQECTDDIDCDDIDITTTDVCNVEAATCLYFARECSEYGKKINIEIETYWNPDDDGWTITDENGVIQLEGGPYGQAYFNYTPPETCFIEGVYTVAYTGSGWFGMVIEANDEVALDYLLRWDSRVTTFEVDMSSLLPTATTHPSLFPTTYPSIPPTISLSPSISRSKPNVSTTSPSKAPTPPLSSPISLKKPTKKCARENFSSKECNASTGKDSCCPRLVCHEYEMKCVKGNISKHPIICFTNADAC